MKRYWIRAIKYMVLLCLLFLGLMALMFHLGAMGLPTVEGFWETLQLQLFATERGRLMLPAILLLSLFYPRFGFVKRTVEGCNLTEHRTQIENAFKAYGFEPVGEEEGAIRFRGSNPATRLQYLFEDEIRVQADGSGITIEGVRRAAVKIAFRLEGYLAHLRNHTEK